MASKRIAVIGGVLIGLATAYKLLLKAPTANVQVFENEAGPGDYQSGINGGVLHSGLNYAPVL